MVIGLGLAGSAIGNITSGTAGIHIFQLENVGGLPWQYTFMSIVVALVACFLTAFCATSKRKKSYSNSFCYWHGRSISICMCSYWNWLFI